MVNQTASAPKRALSKRLSRFFRKYKLFVLCFFTYALFLHWIGWAEHSLFDFTKAIAEEGRLNIDSYADNNVDRLLINDHYYSNKPIGTPLLAAPIYLAWKGVYHWLLPQAFKAQDLASVSRFASEWYASVSIYDHLSL